MFDQMHLFTNKSLGWTQAWLNFAEDSKEQKKARKRDGESGVITSDMILEMLEESIRTIWRFIRADKYTHNLLPKSRRGMEIELQDPADSELLVKVQTELQTVLILFLLRL